MVEPVVTLVILQPLAQRACMAAEAEVVPIQQDRTQAVSVEIVSMVVLVAVEVAKPLVARLEEPRHTEAMVVPDRLTVQLLPLDRNRAAVAVERKVPVHPALVVSVR